MLSIEDVTKIIERMSGFTDEEIDMYIQISVEKGLTGNPDTLRSVLQGIRNQKEKDE